ncbi:MAG: hypothetical protein RLY78_2142, partial [Pseudomonadota bacterium]
MTHAAGPPPHDRPMTTTPPPPIHAALHLWWLGDPACPVPVGELAG